MKLKEARQRILSGPNDNVERLIQEKDKQVAKGVDCSVEYIEDIHQYAVVKKDSCLDVSNQAALREMNGLQLFWHNTQGAIKRSPCI